MTDTLQESRFDCSNITVYTIADAVNALRAVYSKRRQEVEQPDGSSFDISISQSHLIVEMSIESEKNSGIVTIVDLVGFDLNFTAKMISFH